MNRTVMVAGAGDAVGIRLVNDFLKMGYQVAAGLLEGQEQSAALPNGIWSVTIDPLRLQSVEEAAKKVEEAFGAIDLLVVNVDYSQKDESTILDSIDLEEMKKAFEYHSMAPIKMIHTFLPLLEKGDGKRICVVTSKDSCNYLTEECDDFASHVSKAPLNMAMHLLFNGLRSKGFTFRMYCKDKEAAAEKQGAYAAEQFVRDRAYRKEWEARKDTIAPYKLTDENRFVLRDWMGRELPW